MQKTGASLCPSALCGVKPVQLSCAVKCRGQNIVREINALETALRVLLNREHVSPLYCMLCRHGLI